MKADDVATVTVIGGGVWVAELVDQLRRTLAVDELVLRLVAQDLGRLGLVAAHCRHLIADRPGWSVEASPVLSEAAGGADIVVVMVRVGGLEARRDDEDLARRFSVPGDEGLGPGGAANALRTLPVLRDMADEVFRFAPEAMVLNLVAPLGLTTRVLLERGLDAIGICELPGVTRGELDTCLGAEVDVAYAGLNHLGWFWSRSASAFEVLAPAIDAGLVDGRVFESFGAIPLKYYYWLYDPPAAARLGISRDPARTRRLIELRDHSFTEFRAGPAGRELSVGARDMAWLRAGLVPMLAALIDGRPARGYANVRNGDLVGALVPRDVVVEVPVVVRDGVVRPEGLRDPMPDRVRAFVGQTGRAEDLLYRAWILADVGCLVDSFLESGLMIDEGSARQLSRLLLRSHMGMHVG